MTDYAQGRRFGNSNGQAGAFGASTGFGSFGQQNNASNAGFGANSGGGMFGQNNNTTSSGGLSGANQSSGAFNLNLGGGSSTGGGLFGGSNNASSGQTTGGLFGTSGGTGFGTQQSTGFGANNNSQTGGGLFNTNQQKPGGLFGTASTNTSAGGIFGTSGGTTGGFGSGNTGSNIFGQNQTQPQNQGGGIFGQNQSQNQQQNPTGGFGQSSTNPFGGGLGNNNAPKPNPFGASTSTGATGGLFGQNQQQTQNQGGGGLFGANPNAGAGGLFSKQNNTSSPFGQQQNTGGGLGSSLFGQPNQNQQNQAGGLFNQPNQQQQKPSLFGPSAGGGGLFNLNNQAGSPNSTFGAPNAGQNQGGSLFNSGGNNAPAGSLFGNPQQTNNQPPQALITSINEATPYGSSSIFSGLPPPPQANPGPIATPISAGTTPRKVAPLQPYKLNSSVSSRLFATPQKRGYGFSYSNFGTPSSAMSVASTPGGFSSSFLGGSISRSLSKSFSTSNLRNGYNENGESLLSPSAFTSNSSRLANGGLKKLHIDRSLRNDLFTSPTPALPAPEKETNRPPTLANMKKRVSFDSNTVGGNANGSIELDGARPNAREDSVSTVGGQEPSRPLYPTLNAPKNTNGARASNSPRQQEPEVQGNELATVPEDDDMQVTRAPPPYRNRTNKQDLSDPEPAAYWSEPSLSQLKRMSRDQLKKLKLVIGRDGCGRVEFDEPVNLTGINLDELFEKTVRFKLRSIAVYPLAVQKPGQGRGLNVPATVTLENAWPSGKDKKRIHDKTGRLVERFINRLRRIEDSEFLDWDSKYGEWKFHVEHFSTYALDDDVFDDDDDVDMASSVLSEVPTMSSAKFHATMPGALDFSPTNGAAPAPAEFTSSMLSEPPMTEEDSDPDDTFHFMKVKKRKIIPGAFGGSTAFNIEDDEEPEMEMEMMQNGLSFLGERSAGPPEHFADEPSEQVQGELDEDDSVQIQDDDPLRVVDILVPIEEEDELIPIPASLKPTRAFEPAGTPRKAPLFDAHDWTEQLQRTISPRKHDRQALRMSQQLLFRASEVPQLDYPKLQPLQEHSGEITTSIDLMKSLFGREETRRSQTGKQKAGTKGFEV